MRKLAQTIVAAMCAGISVQTAPPLPAGEGAAAERTIFVPRAQETTKSAPVRSVNSDSAVRYNRDLLSGYEQVFRSPCIFPHNRPQPGWRKVQSRRRHNERMRRQRRNA